MKREESAVPVGGTWGERARQPRHLSFFRRDLAERAERAAARYPEGADPIHEYLVDQANLRGYVGAFSSRSDRGVLDEALGEEDIVVGLLQPHAPAETRVLKLVVRMLQGSGYDPERLLLLARRERAIDLLDQLVRWIPEAEVTPPLAALREALARRPPRAPRPPALRYDPRRLLRRRR